MIIFTIYKHYQISTFLQFILSIQDTYLYLQSRVKMSSCMLHKLKELISINPKIFEYFINNYSFEINKIKKTSTLRNNL